MSHGGFRDIAGAAPEDGVGRREVIWISGVAMQPGSPESGWKIAGLGGRGETGFQPGG